MTVVLASGSPRRAEILSKLGLVFSVRAARIDESVFQNKNPAERTMQLAAAKAEAVAPRYDADTLLMAADTVVVLDGRVLDKPKSPEEASEMLQLLSGRTHEVYTGVHLQKGTQHESFCECSQVSFRVLSEAEIAAYVKSGEPMDKAGAYGIQGLGALFVEGVEGDYFNVVGLPVCRLGQCLRKFGLSLLGKDC